jgi:hypothetical protein
MPLSPDPILKTYPAYNCIKTEEVWLKKEGYYRVPRKIVTRHHGLSRGSCQFMVQRLKTPEIIAEQRQVMDYTEDGGRTSNY